MKDLPRLKYDTPEGYAGNLEVALSALQKLHDELEALERDVVTKKQDIEAMWKTVPALKVRRWSPCVKCGRPTQDRFGSKVMCAKHIASGDTGVASVLEDFLYGKD